MTSVQSLFQSIDTLRRTADDAKDTKYRDLASGSADTRSLSVIENRLWQVRNGSEALNNLLHQFYNDNGEPYRDSTIAALDPEKFTQSVLRVMNGLGSALNSLPANRKLQQMVVNLFSSAPVRQAVKTILGDSSLLNEIGKLVGLIKQEIPQVKDVIAPLPFA